MSSGLLNLRGDAALHARVIGSHASAGWQDPGRPIAKNDGCTSQGAVLSTWLNICLEKHHGLRNTSCKRMRFSIFFCSRDTADSR